MKELTQRQKEVLSFIAEFINRHNYPPTIREVAEFFGISVKGAHDHVSAIKKKGFLRQAGKRSRTIELIRNEGDDPKDDVVRIPVLGTAAAGQPILVEEDRDGTIVLPRNMLKKNQEYFALRVRGNSMCGADIMDGDTAIIEKQPAVQNGDIAVVVIDEAVVLKRFYKESNRIRLQSENPDFSPIYSRDVRVLGRLGLIIRAY
jgi:repressor LexA